MLYNVVKEKKKDIICPPPAADYVRSFCNSGGMLGFCFVLFGIDTLKFGVSWGK
jgi:hypothetical protein